MADIDKITVRLWTASESEAGTNGFVYVGVAGREFHVDSSRDDFESGDERTYVFGEDSNVLDAERNDPGRPRLDTDDVERFPVYLRFEGVDNDDHWCVEGVTVTVEAEGGGERVYDNPRLAGTGSGRRIWLGKRCGKVLWLRRI